MSKNVFRTTSLALVLASSALAAPTFAEEYNSDWSHQVGVTGFLFGMEGDAGVKGITAEMDYGIEDVVGDLEGALTLLVQGNNKQYGYWLSYEYVELGDDIKRADGPLYPDATFKGKADFATEIVDGGLSYFISDNVELIGGLRYWNVEEDFRLFISSPHLPDTVQFVESVDESWTDVFGGVRVSVPLGDNLRLNLRGDIGAGDSDSSYQFLGMLAYDLNDCWTTSAGVRYLAVDYAKDGFTFDMRMAGFEVAAMYNF